MIKVVIDTNVLVSASIAKGASYKIMKEILIEKELALLCYSPEVLEEYTKVANYQRIQKKYPLYFIAVQSYIKKVQKAGKLFIPISHFSLITKDVSDNIFLDVAFAADAHYIITGNHNDFTISTFETSKIVSPKLFLELYESDEL